MVTEQVHLAFPTFPQVSVKSMLVSCDCHSSKTLNPFPHTHVITFPSPHITQKTHLPLVIVLKLVPQY